MVCEETHLNSINYKRLRLLIFIADCFHRFPGVLLSTIEDLQSGVGVAHFESPDEAENAEAELIASGIYVWRDHTAVAVWNQETHPDDEDLLSFSQFDDMVSDFLRWHDPH